MKLHTLHQRSFESNRFVYPVISRRSRGLSIGVNLNPDKICNFDCIYCQVDRTSQSSTRFVEMDALLRELDGMLALTASGQIYDVPRFRETPSELRRLNDIAFSGDGEPTTYRNFPDIIASCAELKHHYGLSDVKMVLITNASMFGRSHVRQGLRILDENNGEIWAKLDAGTEDYFQLVDRTPIPFQQVLRNITAAAQVRPLVIQSLFMNVNGQPPDDLEQRAFCDRLNEIVAAGGKIKLVQIYTIARQPAESYVTPLSDREVDALVELVKTQTALDVAAFHGVTA